MFELSVPAARINILRLVARSNDSKIRNMSTTYGTPKIIENIAAKAGLIVPINLKTKVQWRKKIALDWKRLKTVGQSHQSVANKQFNSCLDCNA
jgi:hypothetical protein